MVSPTPSPAFTPTPRAHLAFRSVSPAPLLSPPSLPPSMFISAIRICLFIARAAQRGARACLPAYTGLRMHTRESPKNPTNNTEHRLARYGLTPSVTGSVLYCVRGAKTGPIGQSSIDLKKRSKVKRDRVAVLNYTLSGLGLEGAFV